MGVVIFHTPYGCECGCCGHTVEVDGEWYAFTFKHPLGQPEREFAESLVASELGEEHVENIDWKNCYITDD